VPGIKAFTAAVLAASARCPAVIAGFSSA